MHTSYVLRFNVYSKQRHSFKTFLDTATQNGYAVGRQGETTPDRGKAPCSCASVLQDSSFEVISLGSRWVESHVAIQCLKRPFVYILAPKYVTGFDFICMKTPNHTSNCLDSQSVISITEGTQK